MKTILTLILATLTLARSPVVADSSYVFTIIDDPAANGAPTHVYGINDAGAMVGDFGSYPVHGFVYRDDVFTTIDVPGAEYTLCLGINNAGEIVGIFRDGGGIHGFLLSHGTFTTLNVPGGGGIGTGSATSAHAINASGDIVGDFDDIHGTHGYRYHRGTFTVIDVPGAYSTQAFGINGSGDVVGIAAFPGVGGESGFVLSRDGTYTILRNSAGSSAGDLVTVASGINNVGQVVGYFTDASTYRAFVYENGVFTELATPNGNFQSFALGINDAGQIVGTFSDDVTGLQGFLATPTHR